MKKRYLLQLIIILVYSINGYNQGWDLSYFSPSCGQQVIQSNDTNFVVTGKYGYLETGWTLKLNKFGDVLWAYPYGGYSIIQTNDNSFLVAGDSATQNASPGRASLVKINSNGIKEWYYTYGGAESEEFRAVIQDSELNFVACGTIGEHDYYIVKTDSNGNLLWEKIINSFGLGRFLDLVEVNNFYYAIGYRNQGIMFYLTLLKLNFDGSVEWHKGYGVDFFTGFSIALTSDSSLITTGGSYLIKFSLGGYKMWQKDLNFDSYSVEETSDHGFILAGYPNRLVKVDSLGNYEWGIEYPAMISLPFHSVINTFDYGYIACGCSASDSVRLRVIKTDEYGIISGEFDTSEPIDLRIYPNPTKDIVYIESSTKNHIGVYDINGNLVISQKQSNNIINLGHYSSGIYIIKIETENGIVTRKIIKN